MILPIYTYGQPVLRKIAQDITPDYPDLKQLITNMRETMSKSDGIGLAAPQIGLDIRLLVIDVDPMKEIYPELKGVQRQMINPYIIERGGAIVTMEEGCLSLPRIYEKVPRHTYIKIRYVNANFEPIEETFEGYMARVVQHEYDHLEGQLFIDHISPIRKQLIKSKLNAIIKGNIQCTYKVKTLK